MKNYTNQFPPQPSMIPNGWGPNYPAGMTNLELIGNAPNTLNAGPVMYDLYRTDGGMGSGMVDHFWYDPITQYGNLSSNVADGGGSSELWFLLMNHKRPFKRYPFTSVENMMESSYYNQKSRPMPIAEQTGTGWFTTLNDESRLTASQSVGSKTPTSTSVTATPVTTTKCRVGEVLVNGKCIKRFALTPPPVQAPTQTVRCAPGYTYVNGVCQPVSAAPVPIAVVPVQPVPAGLPPSMGGGGGGGGGAAEKEETAKEEGAGAAVPCKTNYVPVVVFAALGAGVGYLIAKQMKKDMKKSLIISAVIGAILGLLYAYHQCKPIGILSKIGVKSKVASAPPSSGQSSYCGACGAM